MNKITNDETAHPVYYKLIHIRCIYTARGAWPIYINICTIYTLAYINSQQGYEPHQSHEIVPTHCTVNVQRTRQRSVGIWGGIRRILNFIFCNLMRFACFYYSPWMCIQYELIKKCIYCILAQCSPTIYTADGA